MLEQRPLECVGHVILPTCFASPLAPEFGSKSGPVVKTDMDSNPNSATYQSRNPRKSPVPFKLEFPPVIITVLSFRVIVSPSELVFVKYLSVGSY